MAGRRRMLKSAAMVFASALAGLHFRAPDLSGTSAIQAPRDAGFRKKMIGFMLPHEQCSAPRPGTCHRFLWQRGAAVSETFEGGGCIEAFIL